jgi:hypothetical protein
MTQQSNPMTPDWIGLVGGHPEDHEGAMDYAEASYELFDALRVLLVKPSRVETVRSHASPYPQTAKLEYY